MKRLLSLTCLLTIFFLAKADTYVIDPVPNSYLHNNIGLQYEKDGYYYAAIEEFKIAILLNPHSASAGSYYNNLGRMYLIARRYDLAGPCFQKAIKINSNFIEFYQNLIKTYKAQRKLSYALNNYIKTVKNNPTNSQAWLTLGLIYREMKNNDKALDCFDKFLEIEPNLYMSVDVRNIIKAMDKRKKKIIIEPL
ncbi:MAG: tetratricopeptide repeat protein [bacterium]